MSDDVTGEHTPSSYPHLQPDGMRVAKADDVTDKELLPGNFRTLQLEVRELGDRVDTCLKAFMDEMRRDRADLRAEIALIGRRIEANESHIRDHERRIAHLEKKPRRRTKRRGKGPRK